MISAKEIRKDNAVHASLSQMHLSKNARPESPENTNQQTKPAQSRANPACLSGRTVIPTPPSGGAPQRWGPSKPPKSPCQPRQSSKTRPHKTNTQTTKIDDHPANQPDHPSTRCPKRQQRQPAEPKSPLAAADEQRYTDQQIRRQHLKRHADDRGR